MESKCRIGKNLFDYRIAKNSLAMTALAALPNRYANQTHTRKHSSILKQILNLSISKSTFKSYIHHLNYFNEFVHYVLHQNVRMNIHLQHIAMFIAHLQTNICRTALSSYTCLHCPLFLKRAICPILLLLIWFAKV